jgi:hypothetical protein
MVRLSASSYPHVRQTTGIHKGDHNAAPLTLATRLTKSMSTNSIKSPNCTPPTIVLLSCFDADVQSFLEVP